jgi:hypothetical protein
MDASGAAKYDVTKPGLRDPAELERFQALSAGEGYDA